jgi:5-hydroxyisourate hydrolase-like protein (transthyretin family)
VRRTSTLVVLVLALIALRALPQQAPTTSSIEGIVVRGDTGQPLANAQVVLSSVLSPEETARLDAQAAAGNTVAAVPPPQIAPVTTGADGTFSFKDLPAGAYRVAAGATGFVRQEYGQRATFGQGRVLYITAGQSFKDATVRLTPAGTVSGRVFDESGQPATGVPVQLLAVFNNLQGKSYNVVGIAVVNDRGDYRIFGVAPGRYYLRTGTVSESVLQLSRALRGLPVPGTPTTRFSVVYYPNATNLEQASVVEIKAGEESSFDLRVRRLAKTFRVSGRVVDGTGAGIPANLNIMLGWRSFNSAGTTVADQSIDAVTGAFEIRNVPPGEYTVEAQVPLGPLGPRAGVTVAVRQLEQASQPSASVPIRIVDSDIEGLVLTLRVGGLINGRVVVDGKPLSSVPNLERQRIIFYSLPPGAGLMTVPTPAAITANGTFQVPGTREGEYRFQMSVPGFYVKSVKYGEDEILGKPFKFSGASRTLEVTLRAGIATVNGTVTDGKTQPVSGVNAVLVPADLNRLDLFRTVLTDQNGRYSMANLAPGDYKAFSWESIDNNAYFDPEFLKQYEQLGKAIVVSETTNPSVDLRLIPAQ